MLIVRNRPIRTVLRWQLIATAALALLASLPWGVHGAVSAVLGGMVNIVAGWVYGWMVSRGKPESAGEALLTALRAEAVKVALIVVQLWLVFANYRDIVHAGFIIAFVVTVAVFAAAPAVRDA